MAHKALAITAWALATLGAIGVAAAWLVAGGPRGVFPPGAMTDGHHQIGLACESCHTAAPFTDSTQATAALNDACRACHEDELERADDSHAGKRFRGPRMARFRRALDAQQCTTCHVEHRPEITRPGAVTVAMDYCVACHGEGDQDIRANRASHAGLAFDTCATAGCHNYHDNRALYEDFLLDHAQQPWLLASPQLAGGDSRDAESPPIPAALAPAAPASALTGPALAEWAGSAHAKAQVHCAACHAPTTAADAPPAVIEQAWMVAPDATPCVACHEAQAATFARGRHGMRAHPLVAPARDAPDFLTDACCGLDTLGAWLADARLPPKMTVADARLPMRLDAAAETVTCISCHGPHAMDMPKAAADACATCHDDPHTRAYFESPHYDLWRRELAGAPAGTGVSCATCHMEQRKRNRRGKTETSHNQSALLRPVEKMIRPVCLHCHGLGFAIDSLADAELVAANFRGRPSRHVPSIDWALRNAERSGARER